MAMGAGLRPEAKAQDEPPDPTVRAPVLDPTDEGGVETEPQATAPHPDSTPLLLLQPQKFERAARSPL